MVSNNKFLRGSISFIGSVAIVASAFNGAGSISAVSSEDINKVLEEKFVKKSLVVYRKLENSNVLDGTIMDGICMFNSRQGYGYYRNYNVGTLVLCRVENGNNERSNESFKYVELCEFCENDLDQDKAQKFYDLLKKVCYEKECQDFYDFLKENSGNLFSGKLFNTCSFNEKRQYFTPNSTLFSLSENDFLSSVRIVLSENLAIEEVQFFGINGTNYCDVGEGVETPVDEMVEYMKKLIVEAKEKLNASYADVSKSNHFSD